MCFSNIDVPEKDTTKIDKIKRSLRVINDKPLVTKSSRLKVVIGLMQRTIARDLVVNKIFQRMKKL